MFICVCFILQAPEINWKVVMENLDYEGFYVPNEAAFSFFMSIYNLACQVAFMCQFTQLCVNDDYLINAKPKEIIL